MNLFFKKINYYKNSFCLTLSQKKFIKNGKYYLANSAQSRSVGLVQCAKDDKYIFRLIQALNNKKINPYSVEILGIWPYINLFGTIPKISIKNITLSILYNRLSLIKWKKLYYELSINRLIILGNIGLFNNIKNIFFSYMIFKKLRINRDLHNLEINSIKVGDLIYASFIRFRERESIDYNDYFLLYLLFKTFTIQDQINRLIVSRGINFYITTYTSYVQHGVIVRTLLARGIKVFSIGNIRPIVKEHEVGDYTHRTRYWEYMDLLDRSGDLKILRGMAEKSLLDRFSGVIDPGIRYMKKSPYAVNVSTKYSDERYFDGVVYLHDFFDSAFDHRQYLFKDLFIWADHTLALINSHGLNIAIKPHPNGIQEGVKVVNLLKDKYPDLTWIDEGVSNLDLFKRSGAGISVFGSILCELAFHNKVGIAAGEHPAINFNLAYNPKTIEEYDRLLIDLQGLNPKSDCRKKAIDFYVVHNYLINEKDIGLSLKEQEIVWDNDKSFGEMPEFISALD